jgi:hypothetical protein
VCVCDFSNNSVIIQGVSCSLHTAPTMSACRTIYAVQDTILHPRQQCNMPVTANLDDLRNCTSAWLTEPRSLKNGVYVEQTLLPDAHRDIMVRVMNTNQEPRLIRHDTLLRTAESADLHENSIETVSGESPTEQASRKVLAKLPEELTNDQVRQVSSLLTAFSQHDFDIGHTHLVEQTVDTRSHRLIRQPLRRHPVAHLLITDTQIDECCSMESSSLLQAPGPRTSYKLRRKMILCVYAWTIAGSMILRAKIHIRFPNRFTYECCLQVITRNQSKSVIIIRQIS